MDIKYMVQEDEGTYPDDGYEYFAGTHKIDIENIDVVDAVLIAEYHYNSCGGWEYDWPLTFEIYIDGKIGGIFKVECENIPQFHAKKIKKGGDAK